MAVDPLAQYNIAADQWPDIQMGRVLIAPVRVGVNRRTGKVMFGWDHVIQSIEVLFATRYHERVLRRWVGSFVPHVLGELMIEKTITRFSWAVAVSLELNEPDYSIARVHITDRADGRPLNSPEQIRLGHLTMQIEGTYRPRGHLGDPTPYQRRAIGLVGHGNGMWRGATV